MVDFQIHYYSSGWQSITDAVTAWRVLDEGLTRAATAEVTLHGDITDIGAGLAYQLYRLQVRPQSTWQTIFLGLSYNPTTRTHLGTGSTVNRAKCLVSLVSGADRLVSDYITYDYFALQSAIYPSTTGALTFRDAIEDLLANPDSGVDTGFTLFSAEDAAGIDHAVDASCNFHRQSLFDAIRTIADRIGYDGFYYLEGDTTPTVVLAPYSKASQATLDHPFVREPIYEPGTLLDVYNCIAVWGGIDAGIPSDGDRWTEYGYAKYNPAIWSIVRAASTNVVSDEDNTVFSTANRFGNKCVKFSTTGSNNRIMQCILTIANTEFTDVDAENRITQITFALKLFTDSANMGRYNRFYLTDSSGNKIGYTPLDFALVDEDAEGKFTIDIGASVSVAASGSTPTNQWYYVNGATTFDWANLATFIVETESHNLSPDLEDVTWGCYIDGFMFIGGMAIEPDFMGTHAAGLNPTLNDATSQGYYGLRMLEHQDTTLISFEQAQVEGNRLLSNLAYPIPQFTVTKAAPTNNQLWPSAVVTYDSVDYRIQTLQYDWNRKEKDKVYTTYKLVGAASVLPPIWSVDNELKRWIK